MDDDLLAGVLEQKGKPPLVMVVDCRASKGWDDLLPREVEIRFAREVTQILVYVGRQPRSVRGNVARLTLQAGGGQLLELRGMV